MGGGGMGGGMGVVWAAAWAVAVWAAWAAVVWAAWAGGGMGGMGGGGGMFVVPDQPSLSNKSTVDAPQTAAKATAQAAPTSETLTPDTQRPPVVAVESIKVTPALAKAASMHGSNTLTSSLRF